MDLRQAARTIFRGALADCSLEQAFVSKHARDERPYCFKVRGASDESGFSADLSAVKRVLIIAAGKAAASMLQGLLQTVSLPPQTELAGVLISPAPPSFLPPGIRYFAGGHPVPNEDSFAGARAALSLIGSAATDSLPAETFCFFLISGGASAMMELPLDSSISLSDTITFYRSLVHSGATITEINTLRKHFSAVKGGRLGYLARGLPNVTLLASDVPSAEIDSLASGPTLPDRSSAAACRSVLQRHGLMDQFPAPVRRFFEAASLPETPKPGTFPAPFVTLLSSDDLAEAARTRAESMGFIAIIDNTCDEWDYRDAAAHLLARLRDLRRQHKRVCLIAAGEVIVRVPAEIASEARPSSELKPQGTGGRNQHFVLCAATLLTPEDGNTVILSAGSDGIDGNSRFAGALLRSADLRSEAAAAEDALRRFDSATLLASLGAAIETGPTGNNLRDLKLLLADENTADDPL